MHHDAFVSAVENIYEAATDPSEWPKALASVAALFNDVGALLLWTKDDGTFGTIVSDSLSDGQLDYEVGGWAIRDIRGQRAVERGYFFSGEPFTDRHLCSEEEIREHPCYSEFLARHGLGFVACIAVSPDPRIGVTLCIQRNANERPPYCTQELEILARIGPHIEKSLRLSIRLMDSESINCGLADALSRMGVGIFALDSSGHVIFSNPTAKDLIGRSVTIIQGRLRVGLGAEQIRIEKMIHRAIRDDQPSIETAPPVLLESGKADTRLALYLLPIRRPSRLSEELLGNVKGIAIFVQSQLGEPTDPALVRDLLGLTLGEARIASLVGFGIAPKEAASKLGITEHTARNVLKRVFSKVGVTKQSELALLLSKLVLH